MDENIKEEVAKHTNHNSDLNINKVEVLDTRLTSPGMAETHSSPKGITITTDESGN